LVTTRTVAEVQAADGQATLEEGINGPLFFGPIDFGTERAAVFQVPMGIGKTRQIKAMLERKERSLIVMNRQALADDIYASCKDTTKLAHYAIDYPMKELKHYMTGANQHVCQLESIHYLYGAKPYTYVMIDGSQLIFLQTASGTLKDKASISVMWKTLK